MSLGEIPARTTLKAYYHLEGLTDSSGNGRTLVNNNGVLFNPAKFNKGADNGTSGTSRSLSYSTINPFSSGAIANMTYGCWFKLNSITTTGGICITSLTSLLTAGGTNLLAILRYSIASGNITFNPLNSLSVTNSSISYNAGVASTSTWYCLTVVKTTTTKLDLYVNGKLVATNTGSGSDKSAAGLYYIAIGGERDASGESYGIIDEFFVEERSWSASEIRKYYTQAKGAFAPH